MIIKTVCHGQTLFDIALQYCGGIDAAFEIAAINGLSISDTLSVGMLLRIPEQQNLKTARYYKDNGIKPATAM